MAFLLTQQETETLWSPSHFRLPSFSIFSFQRQLPQVFICCLRQVSKELGQVKRGIETLTASTLDRGSFRNDVTIVFHVPPFQEVGQ